MSTVPNNNSYCTLLHCCCCTGGHPPSSPECSGRSQKAKASQASCSCICKPHGLKQCQLLPSLTRSLHMKSSQRLVRLSILLHNLGTTHNPQGSVQCLRCRQWTALCHAVVGQVSPAPGQQPISSAQGQRGVESAPAQRQFSPAPRQQTGQALWCLH